jgi:hypothetical protein
MGNYGRENHFKPRCPTFTHLAPRRSIKFGLFSRVFACLFQRNSFLGREKAFSDENRRRFERIDQANSAVRRVCGSAKLARRGSRLHATLRRGHTLSYAILTKEGPLWLAKAGCRAAGGGKRVTELPKKILMARFNPK